MSSEPWQPLLDLFTELRGTWPAATWEWDDRMKCATATVLAAEEPQVRAAVTRLLPQVWTPSTLAEAPPGVRELLDKKGGLRGGQAMFCAPAIGAMIAYGLWWPWSDGSRTSGRFGIANSGRPKELFPLIRGVFGIAGQQAD